MVSGGQQAPLNVHINLKLGSENVTIVSPQPLEVIGQQFDFKFVDAVGTPLSILVRPDQLTHPPIRLTT